MKSLITQLLVVLLIFIAGAVLWSVGSAERQLAEAERTLVTLRYERAAEEFDAAAAARPLQRMLAGVIGLSTTAAERRNLAQYWLGDYDQFLKSDDEALRFIAANAAYRAMRTRGGSKQEVQTRLDEIVKRYAAVLRAQPDNEDAAFNYEFAVRLRGSVSAARGPIPPADLATSGITVHGKQGGPPEDTDTKKFKMIVPMQPDERLEAEEAGRGGRKVRKG